MTIHLQNDTEAGEKQWKGIAIAAGVLLGAIAVILLLCYCALRVILSSIIRFV